MEPNKRNYIVQREITMLVVVFVVVYKCLMPSHIYRGGLKGSRDSREFYHVPRILDIYMC